MRRLQINLLNTVIILIVVGSAFLIYYQYTTNVQKYQQEQLFNNFMYNLQNLQNTINTFPGNFYIEIELPSNVILYSSNNSLIVEYNNKNYTIDFDNNTVVLFNNGTIVDKLLYVNFIYLVKTNGTVYITTTNISALNLSNTNLPSFPNSFNISNNWGGGGGGGGGGSGGGGNNNINFSADCLLDPNNPPERLFWGDINGKNYLPPITSQGSCGDCWAYATANGLDAVYMIRNDKPGQNPWIAAYELAVHCNWMAPGAPAYCQFNLGCKGGLPSLALRYATNFGVHADIDYKKYRDYLYTCSPTSDNYPGNVCGAPVIPDPNWGTPKYFAKNVINLKWSSNDNLVKAIACYGPLVVGGMLGGKSYPSGNPNLPENMTTEDNSTGHAMVIVGYDLNSTLCKTVYGTPKCWILENSWGKLTGCLEFRRGGYYRLVSRDPNTCGSKFRNCKYGDGCEGVYWSQDGFMYIPFGMTPYGITFPKLEVFAIQNVTT
ncbi:MAG: C1 family peptidase [Nanopusillaceae archaeon]